ncbi:MAG: tRNA (adenosine(37)-N6)-threonylcarbamoyltransferase complex dimerization subunit type 1 TsaB [Phaeovulum sp.]|uniref:tRNA (adenosine(37)-N6)-threonylcarbamoyltransferase complex dimerization subunit type 1 TsaB n=1 Tax=Phaeovulum sp. TaxID=2934796 RepID=UPI00273167FB|nr:tRNA (adenosine(37)-N6)-threonylcarbamoyltransferase complex dimerization subunit type 1 TsaB [Phaeovulum sp.]MDP2064129.1 tRNA (adenosine(37)-N6)-threonylcarbamoyltransferase complex dimerization subunit type 1 TsaB [Phaeovulum sp.]
MRSEALILGFDTSAAHCAAALLAGEVLLEARFEAMAKGQAERLMPMLEEMLARAGVGWRDLAALGVGTGPGNFTGVRISVAAARGLALALGIPAVGVSGLEAAAFGLPRPLVVAMDARRGEVYAQAFDPNGAARLATAEALAGELVTGQAVTGSAAPALAGAVPGLRLLDAAMPLSEAVARLAAARRATPQPRPAPLYLRAADAALPGEPAPVIVP